MRTAELDVVFIMAGPACNFSCKYCMQRDRVTNLQHVDPSPAFFNFFDRLPKKNARGQRIRIQFYGGEPLLYFPFIQDFVARYGRKFDLSIISNGGLINEERVNFINAHKIWFSVSHDGPTTEFSRGDDVFKDPRIVRLLSRIEKFGVSSVIHAKNYDPLAISEHTHTVFPGKRVYIVYDHVMDCGNLPAVFSEYDLDDVFAGLKRLFASIRETLGRGEKLSDAQYSAFNGYYMPVRRFLNHYDGPGRFRCGATTHMANIDLEGNLYFCHNSDIITGHVDDYNAYYKSYRPYCEFDDKCKDCEGWMLCGGGCPLMHHHKTNEYYCNLFKTVTPYVEKEIIEISKLLS